MPAQYKVNEFIASSTPFLTPSSNSKSPTTSLAAKGLNSSSPPVFSLIVPHHALKVARPTPAGHEVCTFHVVVSAAAALRMNGADHCAAGDRSGPDMEQTAPRGLSVKRADLIHGVFLPIRYCSAPRLSLTPEYFRFIPP